MESRPLPSDENRVLRRFTTGAALTAAGLNVILFVQTAAPAPIDWQATIVSAVNAFLPGHAPRPPVTPPTAGSPGASPIATSRPS